VSGFGTVTVKSWDREKNRAGPERSKEKARKLVKNAMLCHNGFVQIMRAIVQNCIDQRYFTSAGTWADQKEGAHRYASSFDAIRACQAKGLKSVQIVLTFEESNVADIYLSLGKADAQD
jgi:hypothetical protein